jgi:hypothetical protein
MALPDAARTARTRYDTEVVLNALVAGGVAISLAATWWIASSSPLPGVWYVANGLLHLTCLAWLFLSARYRAAGTPLLLSATFLVVLPLLCYGSLAVALMAPKTSSLIVLRMPGADDFTYVTWAALLVAGAGVLGTVALFVGRGARTSHATTDSVDDEVPTADAVRISPRLADTFWRFGWLLFAGSVACYVVFSVVQGRSPLDYGLFFGEVGSQTNDELEVLPQFLLAGIDLGIPAVLYLVLGIRHRLGRLLLVGGAVGINLILFANLGFKYRLVVVFLALAIVAEGRRLLSGRGRSVAAVVVLAVAVVAFFVVQVRRGDSENRRETTVESYTSAEYGEIVVSSVDIVTPYAAYHAANAPPLNGRSYYEVPLLMVPKIVWPGKPTPATVGALERVVTPDTGAVFPLWAEADANFGFIGLVLFGLALGRLVSWTDALSSSRVEWLVTRALITAVLPSVLSRPMFFWVVQQVLFVVGPPLLFAWWRSRTTRSEDGPARQRSRPGSSARPSMASPRT